MAGLAHVPPLSNPNPLPGRTAATARDGGTWRGVVAVLGERSRRFYPINYSVRGTHTLCTYGGQCSNWLVARVYGTHDCAKTYVCVLYCSPCAPLMAPWLGELEGTSLAIA